MSKRKTIKWSFELCQEIASKYNTRGDFKKASPTGYGYARKHKILDIVCGHMVPCYIKWNINNAHKEAMKYEYRYEFQQGSPKAYQYSHRNGILDIICEHMKKVGNNHKRCIYACEFPNNRVYIGLTFSIEARMERRKNDSTDTVTQYQHLTGLDYKVIALTEYIDKEEASILEGEYLEKYKSNGWIILNKIKTGNLGGGYIKWTLDVLVTEASKYSTRTEFAKKSSSAYNSAISQGLLDIICDHMTIMKKESGYWDNKSICKEASLKYTTRTEFHTNCGTAYRYSNINGWLDEFFPPEKEDKQEKVTFEDMFE